MQMASAPAQTTAGDQEETLRETILVHVWSQLGHLATENHWPPNIHSAARKLAHRLIFPMEDGDVRSSVNEIRLARANLDTRERAWTAYRRVHIHRQVYTRVGSACEQFGAEPDYIQLPFFKEQWFARCR